VSSKPFILNEKGFTLKQKGHFEEALEAYDEAIRLSPDFFTAWFNKGVVLAKLGREEDAADAFTRALRIDPDDSDAWANKGGILVHLGRYEDALKAYKEAIRLDPNYSYAWSGISAALMDLGRHEEALDASNEALRLDPNNEEAWTNKGYSLRNLGRYDEALEAYEQALQFEANSSPDRAAPTNEPVGKEDVVAEIEKSKREQERYEEFSKLLDEEKQRRHRADGITQLNSEQIIADKKKKGEFDVFLCHNSQDKPEVKAIAEQLKACGILPWLDVWELRPGLPWQRALERQIASIKSAAVFVGQSGIGPWQRQELESLISQFVERECPVIPVILPTTQTMPELPPFLRGMHYVNFRLRDPDPISQLAWGITGERPQL
jgi:tetratricopeptide (TPR) repeat protein